MAEALKSIERKIKDIFLKIFISRHRAVNKSFPFAVNANTKILLIRLNKIGDALVTTPFISLLKKETGADIYVLADKKNHFVFRDNPDITSVFVYNKTLSGHKNIIRELRAEKFDILVDLHDDVSNTVTRISGKLAVPVKIALSKKTAEIYTHVVEKKDPAKIHVIERCAALLSPFGIDVNKHRLAIKLEISEESFRKAEERIRNATSGKGLKVMVNLSAGSPARYWGTDRYRQLIDFLQAEGAEVIVVASGPEIKQAPLVVSDPKRVLITEQFTDFAALFKYIDILFSPDTATVHLASIFSKPVFGLYVQYKTDHIIWYPYGCDFDAVVTQEPTLQNVDFNSVLNKFQPFLNKYIDGRKSTTL